MDVFFFLQTGSRFLRVLIDVGCVYSREEIRIKMQLQIYDEAVNSTNLAQLVNHAEKYGLLHVYVYFLYHE